MVEETSDRFFAPDLAETRVELLTGSARVVFDGAFLGGAAAAGWDFTKEAALVEADLVDTAGLRLETVDLVARPVLEAGWDLALPLVDVAGLGLDTVALVAGAALETRLALIAEARVGGAAVCLTAAAAVVCRVVLWLDDFVDAVTFLVLVVGASVIKFCLVVFY